MASFSYTVRDKAGKVAKGKLEGESKEAVQAKLTQMGYIILNLEEQGGLAALSGVTFGTGVKPKDITIFARQFSTMINAGLSLTKCLSILAGQTENTYLRDIIGQLAKDVEAGQSLSEALARHPKVFPPIFVNMVRAGETGGVLDDVLNRVADIFEADGELRAKVKSATTYPATMGVLILIIAAAMMIFVVPVFVEMFASMGGTLPLPTQILVGLSNFVASWKGAVFAVVLIAFVAVFKWWSKGPGLLIWDTALLRLPIIGPIQRKTAVARFTRTFGTLAAAGVPILGALDIVGDTAGNEAVAVAVRKIRAAVKEGETIAKPMAEVGVFPSMVVQMVAVGEETGALDSMLDKVADFYDAEVATAVDGLMSVLESLVMAVMGVIVGGMVVALYMPMFQSITLVQ